MTDLTPQHVLAILFDSEDFPVEISDPEEAAAIVVQRLIDSGFVIKDQEQQPISDVEDLKSEIQRLREAKRRALSLADERAKETVELRLENDQLWARTQP